MAKETKQIYTYGVARAAVKLVISIAIWIVAYFVIFLNMLKCANVTEQTPYIQGYWILFAICTIIGAVAILCKMRRILKITDDTLYYLYGGLSGRKVSIPSSTVWGCTFSTTELQRIYGTANVTIYIAGDKKLTFEDIKDGEEAYFTIMDMIE